MKNKYLIPLLLNCILCFLSSCSVIGDIFKAGAIAGILAVIIVIVLVIWIISFFRGKNT